jgi:DNA-binding response OmpR family regulator
VKKILVIDDEERIRFLYSSLLEDEAYKVFTAANAFDANETLKRENIDLVLLDIKMPEVEGSIMYEMIQLFHKKTKVIVTSVYSLSEQKQTIEGAAGYHDKSESNEILLVKIREALRMDERKNVLVIDDDANWRALLNRQLKEAGFHALEAANGKKALGLIRPNHIDVVILDILLPDSSGLEVYDEIRKQFPQVKIIIASVRPTDEQVFLISDADDYYYKSESLLILISKMKAVLSKTVVSRTA